ncbi:MAG: hypothetical protein ATN31_00275 [Candidatus Epulonipiscioides saccharophilum]|nr:MAG: hypothetical protein ATN31_00275 [Epulopiscium sp. AS2M-Bin001]
MSNESLATQQMINCGAMAGSCPTINYDANDYVGTCCVTDDCCEPTDCCGTVNCSGSVNCCGSMNCCEYVANDCCETNNCSEFVSNDNDNELSSNSLYQVVEVDRLTDDC